MGAASRSFRSIPSVDRLLNDGSDSVVLPRPLAVLLARELLNEIRLEGEVPEYQQILQAFRERIRRLERTRLQPVINATGIPLHTNLGRSPLSSTAVEALTRVVSGYCNLEFQLDEGTRGKRGAYVEHCLQALFQCSGAAIVNNCAAALVLALSQSVREGRPEVVISRGELVQIGGGFRIPEILSASGAVMREVGTTNRTTLEDYEGAISDRTGLILIVHRSNFYMKGFVELPDLKDMAVLGRDRGVPVLFDQGSGAVLDPGELEGVESELIVSEVLSHGIDLVCFSGDKLFGGPQAGLICGRSDLVSAMKGNPMFRALRCDKLTLSALQAVLETYLGHSAKLAPDASPQLPVLESLVQSVSNIKARAEGLMASLDSLGLEIELVETEVEVGGGTLPQSRIPSAGIAIKYEGVGAQKIARYLREGRPGIVGYVANQRCYLDLRTVPVEQDELLGACLRSVAERVMLGRNGA